MKVEFKIQTKIKKPIQEVFQAVIQPNHLNNYFTKTSSGALQTGDTVIWSWSNHPGLPVKVIKIAENSKIILSWPGDSAIETRVEMSFDALSNSETMISIHESGWNPDQEGLNGAFGNCSGWEHMAQCLKAYLQYGIDLRN